MKKTIFSKTFFCRKNRFFCRKKIYKNVRFFIRQKHRFFFQEQMSVNFIFIETRQLSTKCTKTKKYI